LVVGGQRLIIELSRRQFSRGPFHDDRIRISSRSRLKCRDNA
jgi:hypothetical protein